MRTLFPAPALRSLSAFAARNKSAGMLEGMLARPLARSRVRAAHSHHVPKACTYRQRSALRRKSRRAGMLPKAADFEHFDEAAKTDRKPPRKAPAPAVQPILVQGALLHVHTKQGMLVRCSSSCADAMEHKPCRSAVVLCATAFLGVLHLQVCDASVRLKRCIAAQLCSNGAVAAGTAAGTVVLRVQFCSPSGQCQRHSFCVCSNIVAGGANGRAPSTAVPRARADSIKGQAPYTQAARLCQRATRQHDCGDQERAPVTGALYSVD